MQPVHVLVDLENNQPTLDDVRRMVPDVTDVWLFHSPAQIGHLASFAPMGERQTPVPIMRKGSNALDFHLTFYLGYLAAKNPGAKLVVVAIDKGYSPMVEHAKSVLKFEVAQVAFRAGEREKAGGVAKHDKPEPTKKAPVARKSAAKKVAPKKVAAKKVAAKKVAAKKVAAKEAGAKVPAAKKAAAKNAPKPAAKQAMKSLGAPGANAAPTAPAKKTATKKAAAKKVTGGEVHRAAGAAPAVEKAAANPSPAAFERARTLGLQSVIGNLRKLEDKRPKKLKQLERHLASLLGTGAADPAVHKLVAQLRASGAVLGEDAALGYGPAVASAAS